MARFFFTDVIRQVYNETGKDITFWLLGTIDDREIGEQIIAGADCRDGVKNLIGLTDIPVLVELLRQSTIVVTNDSGPMHLAGSLGVPTVSMYGPTDPHKTGPYGDNHKIFRTNVQCSPCFRKECPLKRQLCLDDAFTAADLSDYIISHIRQR